MPPDSSKPPPTPRALPLNPAAFGGPDEIQDAYLKRSIAEMGALNDAISASEECGAGTLPVLSSGAPRSEVMLIKWAPSAAEQQEGVAFFGRAGTASLAVIDTILEQGDAYGRETGSRSAQATAWLRRIPRPTLIRSFGSAFRAAPDPDSAA